MRIFIKKFKAKVLKILQGQVRSLLLVVWILKIQIVRRNNHLNKDLSLERTKLEIPSRVFKIC